MAENKKFYWLKLKRDFFKRHDIKIIEAMPNGKDYIYFYLKLLVESIDHEGTLRFSDTIPYNEQMLAALTDTNIDIVRTAMKLFIELDMMQVFDDQTIYMTQIEKLIGSETKWAGYKRQERKLDNVQQLSNECPLEIEKEIEIEKEKEKESERERENEYDSDTDNQLTPLGSRNHPGQHVVYLSANQIDDLLDKLGLEAFDEYVDRLADFIIEKDAHVKNHYETILKWHREDSKVRQ